MSESFIEYNTFILCKDETSNIFIKVKTVMKNEWKTATTEYLIT